MFEAKVLTLKNEGVLHIVTFDFKGTILQMISLDTDTLIKENQKVILAIKSTNIGLSKELSQNSTFTNQIQTKIRHIKKGKLLNHLTFDVGLESIMIKDSLEVEEGDTIQLFFSPSALSIVEVLDD